MLFQNSLNELLLLPIKYSSLVLELMQEILEVGDQGVVLRGERVLDFFLTTLFEEKDVVERVGVEEFLLVREKDLGEEAGGVGLDGVDDLSEGGHLVADFGGVRGVVGEGGGEEGVEGGEGGGGGGEKVVGKGEAGRGLSVGVF